MQYLTSVEYHCAVMYCMINRNVNLEFSVRPKKNTLKLQIMYWKHVIDWHMSKPIWTHSPRYCSEFLSRCRAAKLFEISICLLRFLVCSETYIVVETRTLSDFIVFPCVLVEMLNCEVWTMFMRPNCYFEYCLNHNASNALNALFIFILINYSFCRMWFSTICTLCLICNSNLQSIRLYY